jgi:UDP-glucose 4-epimerase
VRSLVTGGAGFIGSHLVDALIARGDEVIAIDDLSTGRRENLAEALASGAELIEADITDVGAVRDLFEARRPELVFHLAAQVDIRRSVSDPVYDLNVNVVGTLNLLEASRSTDTRRFVFASTGGAVYGEGETRRLPLDEKAECLPSSPYGQSKHAAEGYLSQYSRLYGTSTVALRLGNVYGPRQDPLGEAGVVAIFFGALLGGDTPRVYGDGRQTRDYVYVTDVVEAFVAAATSGATGTYNIGTGVETSVLELGELLARVCGRDFEPDLAPRRPGEVQRIAIDSGLAAVDLGWTPRTGLEAGLRTTASTLAIAPGS